MVQQVNSSAEENSKSMHPHKNVYIRFFREKWGVGLGSLEKNFSDYVIVSFFVFLPDKMLVKKV